MPKQAWARLSTYAFVAGVDFAVMFLKELFGRSPLVRVGLYSGGNRLRLRLSLTSQNQAPLRESRPQGVTIPNATRGEQSTINWRNVSVFAIIYVDLPNIAVLGIVDLSIFLLT